MNAHNMFVDVSVRDVINCPLLCIILYATLFTALCRVALFTAPTLIFKILFSTTQLLYMIIYLKSDI